MDWHKFKIEEVYKKVESSDDGLSSATAAKRLREHGPNVLKKQKKTSAIVRFLRHTANFFALLLWTGAILAFTAEYISPGDGNLYIGIALVSVIFLNAIFTFWQEEKAEAAMEAFKNMMPNRAKIIRDKTEIEVDASELVPGDILVLEEGDRIPADARLTIANALKVDNSSLTGESEPQLRCLECTHMNLLESRNTVFSSTTVLTGSGRAVVFGTGMNTQIGKVANLTENIAAKTTPIHKELEHFIRIISIIAIVLGIGFFILGFFFERGFWQNMIFAIGIIVANVPEGLLPTVTLALSLASQKMAKKNALIKNLESVETLGSTTVICTDKTGTITLNKMKVRSVMLGEGIVDPRAIHHNPDFDKLLHACVLCNNSNINNDKIIGDPMEGSLLRFSENHMDTTKLRNMIKRIHEEPFDSKTRRMITVNKYKAGHVSYMKGAVEVVLSKCKKILIHGKSVTLQKKHLDMIDRYSRGFSTSGERVLAFAYKMTDKDLEKGYVFIGIVGMLDPPREDIQDAVAKCKGAGIRVIMITGDHPLTAESIAKQVGIVDAGVKTVTGDMLLEMEDQELQDIVNGEVLFARTSPEQKLRIVSALQDNGEIVAVTGDGVNDAPALKNADIGVAMGKCGTDVAKEAADMILLDDNFATIVTAVEEGRTIYDNIKKFIVYILTSNVPQILPFIAFVLLGIPLPLTVVLILAIDLGTDLLPALGLAKEKPESDLMRRPPRKSKERLLDKRMLFRSYGLSTLR